MYYVLLFLCMVVLWLGCSFAGRGCRPLLSTEYGVLYCCMGCGEISIDKSGMPLQMYEVLQSKSKGTQLGTIGFISGEARGRREKYAQVYTPYMYMQYRGSQIQRAKARSQGRET